MKQKRSKLLQFVWGNITMALDYGRTYERGTYVRASTIKHNAATNQIVLFVRVDETFTTI